MDGYLCVVEDVLGDDGVEEELAFFGGGGHGGGLDYCIAIVLGSR